MEQLSSQSKRHTDLCSDISRVSEDKIKIADIKSRFSRFDVSNYENWPALPKSIGPQNRKTDDNIWKKRSFAQVVAVDPEVVTFSSREKLSSAIQKPSIVILKRDALSKELVQELYPWKLASEQELWPEAAQKIHYQAAGSFSNSLIALEKDKAERLRSAADVGYQQILDEYPGSVFAVFSRLAFVEKTIVFPEYDAVKLELKQLRKISEMHVDDYQQAREKCRSVKTSTNELHAQHKSVVQFYCDKINKPKKVLSEQKLVYAELQYLAEHLKGYSNTKLGELSESLQIHSMLLEDESGRLDELIVSLKNLLAFAKKAMQSRENWREALKSHSGSNDGGQSLPESLTFYYKELDDYMRDADEVRSEFSLASSKLGQIRGAFSEVRRK